MFGIIAVFLGIAAAAAIIVAAIMATDVGLDSSEGAITFVICIAAIFLCWLFLWLNATASVGYALREHTPYKSQIYKVADVTSRGVNLDGRKDFLDYNHMINVDITTIKAGDYVVYTCVKTDFEIEYVLKFDPAIEADFNRQQEEMKQQKK